MSSTKRAGYLPGMVAVALFAGITAENASAQSPRPPTVAAVCASCHGADGSGGNVLTPSLAGQRSIYLRQQLLAFRSGKRKHPEMKTVARDLTDREIDQLVVYFSTLPAR